MEIETIKKDVEMSWEMVRLGDVLDYEQPTNYIVTSDFYDDSFATPVLTAGKSFVLGFTNEVDGVFTNLPVIIFDDFTTASKYVDFPFKVKSSAMKILKAKEGLADTRFMFYLLQTLNLDSEQHKRYWISKFAPLQIPLPPLPTQKRIAEILDAADALRRKDQELLKKYDELAQAIFIDMFGDPVKNEKGWALKPFGELFDSRLGKMLDAKKQNGIFKHKYLGNSNVKWFSFQLNNLAEMTFDEKELKTFDLQYGDLLICEGGEVGRSAVWKDGTKNIFFQKAIHRARARTQMINTEYVAMLFWFYAKFGGFNDFVTTSTISHLSGEKLKTIPIPVPPKTMQEAFAKQIENLNEISNISKHGAYQELFNSLLQKAFKGELD
jgi:type I restriction enzyme, S subunit